MTRLVYPGSATYVDIKAAYGVKGDGATDDTAALQAALSAEDVVFLPAGTYRISAALSVPADTAVVGEGDRATIVRQYTSDTQIFIVNTGGVTLRDLRLTYNTLQVAANTSANAVELRNAFVCNFQKLHISNCANGFKIPAGIPGGSFMASCSFRDIEVFLYSIYAFNLVTDGGVSTGSVFSNIYIHNNPSIGVRNTATGGLNLGFHSDSVLDQVNVEHSVHTGNSLVINGCESMMVNGVHFEGVEPSGDFGGVIGVIGGSNVVMTTVDIVFCYFLNANVATLWGMFKVENGCSLTVHVLRERNSTIGTASRFPVVYATTSLTTTVIWMGFVNVTDLTTRSSGSAANPFRYYNGLLEAPSGALIAASNLSDLASASTARTSLGLGTAAVTNTGTGAGNTILGNDARLTDSRAPTAHSGTHRFGGADLVTSAPAVQAADYLLPFHAGTGTNAFGTLGKVYLLPADVPASQTFSGLGTNLSVLAIGGTTPLIHLGCYADDGTGLKPTGAALAGSEVTFDPTAGSPGDIYTAFAVARTYGPARIWLGWMLTSGSALGTNPTAVVIAGVNMFGSTDLGNNSYRGWAMTTSGSAATLPTISGLTHQGVTPIVGMKAS